MIGTKILLTQYLIKYMRMENGINVMKFCKKKILNDEVVFQFN